MEIFGRRNFLAKLLIFVFLLAIVSGLGGGQRPPRFEPYEILGVHRRATQQEIR